jgi:serine/threonine protein kinase
MGISREGLDLEQIVPKVSDVSFLRPIECPRCGAPLPGDALDGALAVCPFCDGTSASDPRVVYAARFEQAFRRAETGGDVRVCGTGYAIGRTLGSGTSCDVYEGRRVRPPSERVIVKVRRGSESFEREAKLLERLSNSDAPGTDHFRTRLPQVVAQGVRERDGAPTIVFRYLSGFDHTAVDVRRQHGDRLDPRHGAWMFRRILELLIWVHASGFVHGAITPEHLVVNARDHGAMLVGWSRAERSDRYSEDVAHAARTIGTVLGGAATPNLAALLIRCATRGGDAAAVEQECLAAARKDFGASSRFVPLLLA